MLQPIAAKNARRFCNLSFSHFLGLDRERRELETDKRRRERNKDRQRRNQKKSKTTEQQSSPLDFSHLRHLSPQQATRTKNHVFDDERIAASWAEAFDLAGDTTKHERC